MFDRQQFVMMVNSSCRKWEFSEWLDRLTANAKPQQSNILRQGGILEAADEAVLNKVICLKHLLTKKFQVVISHNAQAKPWQKSVPVQQPSID